MHPCDALVYKLIGETSDGDNLKPEATDECQTVEGEQLNLLRANFEFDLDFVIMHYVMCVYFVKSQLNLILLYTSLFVHFIICNT